MDRLQDYIEHAIALTAEVDQRGGGPSCVEFRNSHTSATATDGALEVDGEELVSLLSAAICDGLHAGLSSWDVLEQLQRVPDLIDVYLAPRMTSVDADSPLVMGVAAARNITTIISDFARHDAEGGALMHQRDRVHHSISTKFIKGIVNMVRGMAQDATPTIRGKVFLRCALNQGSLTAVLEAICGLQGLDESHYKEGGLLRDRDKIKMLLETVAPIGGPNLRVRAAANLFDVSPEKLLRGRLDPDATRDLIADSGASRAAQHAAKTAAAAEAEEAVAFLCSTVAMARDVLTSFTISIPNLSGATIRFALELSLPSDANAVISRRSLDRPAESDVIETVNVKATRTRANTIKPGTGRRPLRPKRSAAVRSGSAEPTDDSPPPSAGPTGRRTRAMTVAAPAPATNARFQRGTSSTSTSLREREPSSTSTAYTDGSSSKFTGDSSRFGGSEASGKTFRRTRTSPQRSPTRSPARSPRPSSTAAAKATTSDGPPSPGRATAPSSPLGADDMSSAAAAAKSDADFSEEQLAKLKQIDEQRREQDARLDAIRAFVAQRPERDAATAQNCEHWIAAYEAHVQRHWAAFLAGCANSERSLMAFHDRDANPQPVAEADAAVTPQR